ncbi:phthiocerol/phthiodiolone dimycocerosyl transferase family protein [Segniliparus rugosus]|uniref:Phthiocerol/phthiodiolone dimycocerosyl transferase n=1 Tax=Segniliparus rugosus (strain ATCC BAA-974 / DSM 45345 / CCUG 50838 / CIP 108380 / JCM 13579 / CDC 945) TaxID=679197 RepID=E5XQE3_SEGRC|nr:hypothetical protein [Segniliparus rugosus]EFV13426.2 hypothetical protein HMPREF9336_01715 [Segniliparus rugosus ATCC BAA-974]
MAQDAASRPLSRFEMTMAAFGMTLGIVSQGRGQLDESAFRKALVALRAKYPVLGAQVRLGASGFELSAEPEGEPVFLFGPGDVDAPIGDDDHFLTDGKAFGVRVVTAGERFRVTCVGHHALMDGRHFIHYMFELFSRYTDAARGEAPDSCEPLALPGTPEELLAERGHGPIPFGDFLRQLYENDVAELLLNPPPAQAGGQAASSGEALGALRIINRRVLLNNEETAALVEMARKHGVSLHALLSAATVLVELSLSDSEEDRLVVLRSSVDIRNRVYPPVAVTDATNFAGATVAVFPASRSESPEVWARHVGDQLAADLQKGLLPQSVLLLSKFIGTALKARGTDGAEPARIFITNVGALPPLPLPDGVVVDDMEAMVFAAPAGETASPQASVQERSYVVVTYGGKLSISLYLVGRDGEEADQIVGRLVKAIAEVSDLESMRM